MDANTLGSDVSNLESGLSDLATRIGNVADQVKGVSTQAKVALNTPIVVTLPTASSTGEVSVGVPSWVKWTIGLGVGIFVVKVIL